MPTSTSNIFLTAYDWSSRLPFRAVGPDVKSEPKQEPAQSSVYLALRAPNGYWGRLKGSGLLGPNQQQKLRM